MKIKKNKKQSRTSQTCGRMSSMRSHISELVANTRPSIETFRPDI